MRTHVHKTAAVLLALLLSSQMVCLPSAAQAEDTAQAMPYTYEITPLLAPFNEYFYVKTDNPDPYSFRFVDADSAYSDKAAISMLEKDYMDVKYENTETRRVHGGYIFYSGSTDGGELLLQQNTQTAPPRKVEVLNLTTRETEISYDRNPIWVDTEQTFTLPELYDDTDYLIHQYADRDSFFANLDAVQYHLKQICLYSGSYVRGELQDNDGSWFISNSPHADQSFYIQTSYSRKGNRSLLMSALYPYRYDSLSFPAAIGAAAKRLDSKASYTKNKDNHYQIEVEYDGATRTYGGQGTGKGQGIDADQIMEYFTFEDGVPAYQLGDIRYRLNKYAELEVSSDIPQENKLTWDSIYEAVGGGSWIRMTGIASVFGGTYGCYGFLYQMDSSRKYHADDTENGGSIYWSGSLGYASDAWVDGRYVDKYERFVPGETFDKHPKSSIILTNCSIPSVKYSYRYETDPGTGQKKMKFIDAEVTETQRAARFSYQEKQNMWVLDDQMYSLSDITQMTEQGKLDPKYLDVLTLTPDEVAEMQVDRNTNAFPTSYLRYDGIVKPGTSVFEGDVDDNGSVEVTDIVALQKQLLGMQPMDFKKPYHADLDGNGIVDIYDLGLLKRRVIS